MNSQSSISKASLPKADIPRNLAEANLSSEEDQQLRPEADLWEPPFERWLRLADDLLRDWPGTHAA